MNHDRQLDGRQAGQAVLLTAALGTMLAPLNSTMIVVALPEILDAFRLLVLTALAPVVTASRLPGRTRHAGSEAPLVVDTPVRFPLSS